VLGVSKVVLALAQVQQTITDNLVHQPMMELLQIIAEQLQVAAVLPLFPTFLLWMLNPLQIQVVAVER
jgi:hypothetical protein